MFHMFDDLLQKKRGTEDKTNSYEEQAETLKASCLGLLFVLGTNKGIGLNIDLKIGSTKAVDKKSPK